MRRLFGGDARSVKLSQQWNENPSGLFAPASVMEVVTFGYKAALKCFWPLTVMTAFFSLSYGPAATWYVRFSQQLADGPSLEKFAYIAFFSLFTLGITLWGYYAMNRYARDLFLAEPGNPLACLVPGKDLLGALAVGFFYLLALFGLFVGFGILSFGVFLVAGVLSVSMAGSEAVIGIIVIVSLLALMVPMFLCVTGLNTVFGLVLAAYVLNSDAGVFHAFGETFRVLGRNFWRTVGLSFMCWLVNVLLMIPVSAAGGVMGYMSGNSPSFLDSPAFLVGYTLLATVGNWLGMVIGMGGFVNVVFRYYYDLKIRAGRTGDLQSLDAARTGGQPIRSIS